MNKVINKLLNIFLNLISVPNVELVITELPVEKKAAKSKSKRKPKKRVAIVKVDNTKILDIVEVEPTTSPVIQHNNIQFLYDDKQKASEVQVVEMNDVKADLEDKPLYIEGEIEVGDLVQMKPELEAKQYYFSDILEVVALDGKILKLFSPNCEDDNKYHILHFNIIQKKR
jgi:hypothetical protein